MESAILYGRMLRLPLDGMTSILLVGPRGVGKTTFIKQQLPKAPFVDLSDFTTFCSLSSNPSNIETLIPQNYGGWIIVKDVQQFPKLLDTIAQMITLRKARFILSCSNIRALQRHGSKFIAEKVVTYTMHPLTLQEMGDHFELAHALTYGLLPAITTKQDPQEYLRSCQHAYLRQDINQNKLTRNLSSFARFLEEASCAQGGVINYSEMSRELCLNRFMVADYFSLLEDLLLGIRINVFSQNPQRKLSAHQKFYFFDTGFYKVARPTNAIDARIEADGAEFETLFLQSLRALNDYLKLDYKIYFWRTQTGLEVDFVILGPSGFHAFEIKRSNNTGGGALRGLKAFGEEYPEAKLHYIFCGNFKEYHGNITAIPFEQALKELPNLIS